MCDWLNEDNLVGHEIEPTFAKENNLIPERNTSVSYVRTYIEHIFLIILQENSNCVEDCS